MSDSIVVKCPEYVSGMCMRAGCGGILARPYWTGTDENGCDLYAASCPHGPELFRNLTAEKPASVATVDTMEEKAKPVRHYRTRAKISLDRAVKLTGLSKRTIQNLISNPRNTGFVGLNVEDYVLIGWAIKYDEDKVLAHWANAANHPIPISKLPEFLQRKLGF